MPEQLQPKSPETPKFDVQKLSDVPFAPDTIKLQAYLDRANELLKEWTRQEGLPDKYAPNISWGSQENVAAFDKREGEHKGAAPTNMPSLLKFSNTQGNFTVGSYEWDLEHNLHDPREKWGYPSDRKLRSSFNAYLREARDSFQTEKRTELLNKKIEVAAKTMGIKGGLFVVHFDGRSSHENDRYVVQCLDPENADKERKGGVGSGPYLRAIPITWNEKLEPVQQIADIDRQIQRCVQEALKIEAGNMTPGIEERDGLKDAPKSEEEKLRDENAALKAELERLKAEKKK